MAGKREKSNAYAKLVIKRQTTPAKPAIPGPRELPQWMFADPMIVVERIELQALAKAERAAVAALARRRKGEEGLTPLTVRTMRRMRIRELLRNVLRGARNASDRPE